VIVTNKSNSCTNTSNVTVTNKTVLMDIANVLVTPLTICLPGTPDGSGQVTAITEGSGPGNTGDYRYTWATDAAMTSTIGLVNDPSDKRGGLAAGTYYVTAKRNIVSPPVTAGVNGSGCVTAARAFVVLDEQAYPTIDFTVTPNSACDSNYDGQLVAVATTAGYPAGTQYNFAWTVPVLPVGSSIVAQGLISSVGAGSTATFTTAMATDRIGSGQYTVIVTNKSNSCTNTSNVTVTNKTVLMDIANVLVTPVNVCPPTAGNGSGQVTAITEASGPVPTTNYKYTWATDAAMTSTIGLVNDPSDTRGGLAVGTYYVTGKRNIVSPPVTAGVNGSSCVTAPRAFTVLDQRIFPGVDGAPLPDEFCTDAPNPLTPGSGSVTTSITSLPSNPINYSYQWVIGNSLPGSAVSTIGGVVGGVNGKDVTDLQEGDYTVRVTATATGCFTDMSFKVVNAPTIVDFDLAGFSALPVTTCDPTTGMPSNGTAKVTSILENSAPQPSLTNYNFTWSDATNPSLPDSPAPTLGVAPPGLGVPPGTYYVKAFNTVSSCKADHSFLIDDNTIGSTTVSLLPYPLGFEQPEQCVNPKTGFLAVDGLPGYTYYWYTGDQRLTPPLTPPTGPPALFVGSSLTNITMAPNQIFTVKAVNSNGCWAVDAYSIPLIVNPIVLVATADPLTYCTSDNGEVVATIANDSQFDYNFVWNKGNSVSSPYDYAPSPIPPSNIPGNGNDVTSLAAGKYTVMAIDNVDPGCVSPPVTVTVRNNRVFPLVTATSKALTICDTTFAKPDGYASADVGGDFISYTFDWFKGNLATGTSFFSGAEVGGLFSINYTVLATDRITGCTGSATISVPTDFAPIPAPTVVVTSNVTSCITNNGELSATVGGVTKDYIFDWANGSNAPPPNDFTGDIYKGLSEGNYAVVATSRNTGCKSGPAITPILDEKLYPTFEFLIQDATCSIADGQIVILITNGATIDQVTWTRKDGTPVSAEGLSLLNAMAGEYKMTLTTNLGCKSDGEVNLPANIQPFNGVSRLADGKNDFFEIGCIQDYEKNHVEIFNRAGTKVFEADGYNNIDVMFDGKSNRGISIMGTNLPAGTYFYVISKGNGSKHIAGYLELVE
jgi:hypothetical protein